MVEKTIENDMQSIRDDIAALRADLSAITQDLKSMGKSRAEATKENLSATAQSLKEEITRLFDETRERGKKSVEAVETEIGERPFTSLLISFGAGLILAKLLERK
jgi:ElaB/YqjD/DUF883 family membrane-anchored ribosome-binding protein